MKIFKKENTRKYFGFLFEHFLEKNVLNNYFSDLAYYSKCINIIEEYCKDHYGINWKPLEELFEDLHFTDSIQFTELIENLVNGLHYIPMNNLSWEKDDEYVDGNFLLDYVFEHPDLPYYYILHNNQNQSFLLVNKNSGNNLPFILYSVLPSFEMNVISGRFEEFMNFDSDEYYRVKFDISNPQNSNLYDIVRVSDLIQIPKELKSSIDTVIYSSIQPSGSNVPLSLIPLVDPNDIIIRNLILDQINKKNQKLISDDGLPF